MLSFLDTLIYTILSFAQVFIFLGGAMLLLRQRAMRRNPFSREKWLYITFSGFFLIVWLWNGVHPTSSLFEERAGLYWGIKTENVGWSIYTAEYQSQPQIAYEGFTSLAVNFQNQKGWLIFHHYPTSLPFDRYQAIEFYVLRNDLKTDPLIMALYADGKIKYPSDAGLLIEEKYFCNANRDISQWACIRVPLTDFKHPGTGVVGLAIGKADGQDSGRLYIDNFRLIEK